MSKETTDDILDNLQYNIEEMHEEIKRLRRQNRDLHGKPLFDYWCSQCSNVDCDPYEMTQKGPFPEIPSNFYPRANPFDFLSEKPDPKSLQSQLRDAKTEIKRLQLILDTATIKGKKVTFKETDFDDHMKYHQALAPYCPKCNTPSVQKKEKVYICHECNNQWTLDWYFRQWPNQLKNRIKELIEKVECSTCGGSGGIEIIVEDEVDSDVCPDCDGTGFR